VAFGSARARPVERLKGGGGGPLLQPF